MFVTTDEYLYRITYALENVIAPQIESDYMRGQVLAAVFLLDQLIDRIDYKADIVMQEIETGCETMRKVVEAVQEKTADVPEDLRTFLQELDRGGYGKDLAFRNRCNEMLCSAIDVFFASRHTLDQDRVHEIEDLLLGQFIQIASRDLGMTKPSTSQKLLQSKK